jgi:hypothetical protein
MYLCIGFKTFFGLVIAFDKYLICLQAITISLATLSVDVVCLAGTSLHLLAPPAAKLHQICSKLITFVAQMSVA